METIFNNFYFTTEEDVTLDKFSEKIDEALVYLKKSNQLSDESFTKIRHSFDQAYTIGNRHFAGQYISYSISKNAKYIAELNCFISNNNEYFEVQTWQ